MKHLMNFVKKRLKIFDKELDLTKLKLGPFYARDKKVWMLQLSKIYTKNTELHNSLTNTINVMKSASIYQSELWRKSMIL